MKVFNVNVEAKMQFGFPIVANDSQEASKIVYRLAGMNGVERDDEVSLFLAILTDFLKERFSKDGEVICGNLAMRADIFPESNYLKEEIEKIGLFRMHPAEESRMEEPDRISALLETMGVHGVLMEVSGTACNLLFDERGIVNIDDQKYLIGAFYVVGRNDGHFCEPSIEDICKVKIIMSNRKVNLNADGEDIPVFRLS